jgi:hypothetical protein
VPEYKPETMDTTQQVAALRDIAAEVFTKHGDRSDKARDAFFDAATDFNKVGSADTVAIWHEAIGLDPRTGAERRPDLQPYEAVNTATADITKTAEHIGKTIPQRGVNQ